ncbi:hypothetical protein EKK70_09915 [Desulfovibrio sp. DS-1]|nr:hypothetical protein EKK70_09915 [Desulfovibrio sp. DS-1]
MRAWEFLLRVLRQPARTRKAGRRAPCARPGPCPPPMADPVPALWNEGPTGTGGRCQEAARLAELANGRGWPNWPDWPNWRMGGPGHATGRVGHRPGQGGRTARLRTCTRAQRLAHPRDAGPCADAAGTCNITMDGRTRPC